MFEKLFNFMFEKKENKPKVVNESNTAIIEKKRDFVAQQLKQKTCLSNYFYGLKGLK